MRRSVAALLLVLLAGCSSPQRPEAAAAPPDTVAPAVPATGGSDDTGSGISPPSLTTYGAKLSDRQVLAVRAPTHLRIPGIGVDQNVGAVGVAPDGQLAVPPDAGSVSWYRFGPSPGDTGAAVLAGHVDFSGTRGVFWRLDELQPGQRIAVAYDDGATRGFTVTTARRYPKTGLPVADLFTTTGPPSLVLITCGGSFDQARHSYRDNVVVTAQPDA